jgi:predicted RNA-binding protein with PUA-like domain
MACWLVKSEPEAWSWQQQTAAGTTHWDGVRNHQASNSLKAMRLGDPALFYHSGSAREIVGLVEVVREYYPDPSDETGRFGMVDVRTLKPFARPVTLAQVKAEPRLSHLALVRQSRLSVMPVDDDAFRLLCALGGVAV